MTDKFCVKKEMEGFSLQDLTLLHYVCDSLCIVKPMKTHSD